jgi:glyoxylase-like metal-dependent hydrolase (beta-lactamase superfamily II)
LKLGELEFHILSDGDVWLDGGAMFGVVPKPLWEKKMAPDARNRIQLAMNCLLVRAPGKTVLVETGAGTKMPPKLREIYGLGESTLLRQLMKYDLHASEIDIVINTHLHFDHCGGNTRHDGDRAVATFPNAKYVVQRGEYEHALHANERDNASYFLENYVPLEKAGKLALLSSDRAIAPGVELVRVPGHTANMQCVKLSGGGKSAFFFADLVPTAAHLPLPWIMGYDLFPMTTLENKKKWIPEVVKEGWIALFGQDAHTPAGYLKEKDGRFELEPVAIG